MTVIACVALAAAVGLSPALAAAPSTLADALAKCHSLSDASRRLDCYDQASGRATTTQGAPAAGTAAGGEATSATATASSAPSSLIGAAWLLDPDSSESHFEVRPYKANYLLPVRYSNRMNNAPFSPSYGSPPTPLAGLDDIEAQFQFSFKARLWKTFDRRWSVWAAYTQQSQWQVYSSGISRPFRETNYEPELMLAYNPEVEFGGFRWRLATLSLNHQSNGRAVPLSRSWNRLIGSAEVERENLVLKARAWSRFKESADKDDNPDITDYLGYGDLTALYKWNGHTFKVMGRGNLRNGKGAGEFTWSSPQVLGPLRLYAKVFTGYGESLIDYNWNQTSVGVGLTLNDLF
jgi:phospholipase A1/A2